MAFAAIFGAVKILRKIHFVRGWLMSRFAPKWCTARLHGGDAHTRSQHFKLCTTSYVQALSARIVSIRQKKTFLTSGVANLTGLKTFSDCNFSLKPCNALGALEMSTMCSCMVRITTASCHKHPVMHRNRWLAEHSLAQMMAQMMALLLDPARSQLLADFALRS